MRASQMIGGAALLLLATLPSGCASPQARAGGDVPLPAPWPWRLDVRKGATTTGQVLELIGRPDSVERAAGGAEVWRYEDLRREVELTPAGFSLGADASLHGEADPSTRAHEGHAAATLDPAPDHALRLVLYFAPDETVRDYRMEVDHAHP